ncbi:MAG: TonB-dependent receptor [Candidatus Azobacteroides sp.]|nr:TonB-dependent receptor [Candidatus Azobacteroides sp.]
MKMCFLKKQFLFLLIFWAAVSLSAVAQNNLNVKGIVTDPDGEALIGVTVLQVGSTNGTITDVDGHFSLNVPQGTTLRFSYIGYETVEHSAASDMKVTMGESKKVLDELVVIGYGVQKKSVTTAAISSVKASDLEKLTASRIENVLNGQVSGISMTQNSGSPGSDVSVRIRGVGTTGNNDPLYIVDGMAVDGGIKNLNPADIASVEVLKDGASAAVYGSRGGNGVIIITTKRGQAGKPKINYEMNLGWQNPWRKLPLFNSEQYMLMINEFNMNANSALPFTNQQILDARSGKIPNTNWQDIAFNNNAPITDHQVSVQGGNDQGAYFLSLGRFNQDGILGGNYDASNYNRWTVRANSDYEIFKTDTRNFLNKIKVGMNVTYSRGKSISVPNNDLFASALASAIALPPTMAPYLSQEEGEALLAAHPYALVNNGRVLTPSPSNFQELRNPLAIYLRPDQRTYDEDKFIGTFWGELSVLPGLTFRSSYGFDLAFWGENQYRFPYFQSYNTTGINDERADFTQAESIMNRGFTRQVENTLTYDFKINDHSFTLLAGQSARDYEHRYLLGRGKDLKAYDTNMAIINNARMDPTAGGRYSEGYTDDYKLASYFGRISYNYAERYMFQATVRYDGSSKFGPSNKWGAFPSFSLGWNVWNEPYFQSSKPIWWDALKLRGSWGINGSDRIVNADNLPVNYAYLSLMESGLNYYFGNQLNYGISAGRLPNPAIKWEESHQTDLGADFLFLNGALSFSFDWFKKRTKYMLREAADVPDYVGQSKPYVNAGTVDNSGVEFDLGYRFSPARGLNMGIKGNASYVKNTVVDYGNEAGEHGWGTIGAAGYDNMLFQKNGYPNPFFYGYATDGILQNQAEADAYNLAYDATAQPGDVRFKDLSGPDGVPDGVIDANDRTKIGKPNPDWTYGITLTADYKGFDLMVFFQGRYGCEIFDISRRTDIPNANLPVWWMDRWTGEGTSNKYPRFAGTGVDRNSNWRISDLYIQDGSFTRLKNVQLGYTLPQNFTRKASIERLRFWVGGENLLTFTHYRGFDPEIADKQNGVSIMGNYPVARIFNCGLGITF